MNMIERVARAIHCNISSDYCWPYMLDDEKELYRIYARAALIAMREPDEAMVEAGQATECEHGDMTCGAANAWRAMIEVALNEKG